MKPHSLSRAIAVFSLALSMTTLASCSDEPGAKPAAGDSSVETAGNDEPDLATDDIRPYFEAVVSADPDLLESALTLAAPGSIAEAYIKYQRAGIDASIDGGTPEEASDLEKIDDGYRECANPDDPTDCVTWSDFESEGDKLADFTVNGVSLKNRVTIGNGSKAKAGALGEVEFLVAYQSVQSGDLFVLVRVESGKQPISINSGSAAYRGPDRRQSENSSYYGIDELEADSTGTLALVFTRAKVGGTATLTFNSEDYRVTAEAKIRTR
jgi:hypothetical protein